MRNRSEPERPVRYKRHHGGLAVRLAVICAMGAAALAGALYIMRTPSTPLGAAKHEAAIEQPMASEYAAAAPSASTVNEDGSPASATPQAEPADAAPARDVDAAAPPQPPAPVESTPPPSVTMTPAPSPTPPQRRGPTP
jgi:hypothetical protein